MQSRLGDARRDHTACERSAQAKWLAAGIFESDPLPGRPKWFIVELPPFASGALHLGHLRNYTIGDVIARFRRMTGHNVLYTTGFDAFGLPNENAARESGSHPLALVERNIGKMLRAFSRLGLSHDRRRILSDHEPRYYRWVQWMFLKLLGGGHIYRRKGLVNWCPKCRSTLAENLVEQGRCWRCASEVNVVEMDRWYVREIDFAISLLDREDPPGWPKTVTSIHRDWIGRQEGIEVRFRLCNRDDQIIVFTTVPEMLPTAAFLGVGPLNPLVASCHASHQSGHQVDLEIEAIEPLTGRPIPVFLVRDDDRIVEEGVILGCPLSDGRDRDIWSGLRSREWPSLGEPMTGEGRDDIIGKLIATGAAARAHRYRLRDWDIARPRYWGTPVPIIHCDACGPVPVPDDHLPVLLPEDVELGADDNPLASTRSFVVTQCPRCAAPSRRDTDTIETYASPWWFYLICSAPEVASPFDPETASRWIPVDVMIGGADQIRTCFFHLRTMAEAMTQLGIVDERLPVRRLITIGMVKQDGRKMSKSAANAVDLEELIDRYGADVLRLAVLSSAAPDQDINWNDDLLIKALRFIRCLERLFDRAAFDFRDLASQTAAPSASQLSFGKKVAAAERRVTGMLERCAFHLVLQELVMLLDHIDRFAAEQRVADRIALAAAARTLLVLTAPLAPHIGEQLWEEAGGAGLLAEACWPSSPLASQQPTNQRRAH